MLRGGLKGPAMIVFLDFEASPLSPSSFPVEVGWVTASGMGEGHLIRPAACWDDWSPAAEKLQGLSRDLLEREGEAVENVAHRLLDALGADGAVIASDTARWDQM
jgi:hypothetical protein